MTIDSTPGKSPSSAPLGPSVPHEVMLYVHAYGDSRADDDGLSGLRIGEAVLALRRWAAHLQAAERERMCDATKAAEQPTGRAQIQRSVYAWMHADGRIVPAATKETAERDGGAMRSSLAGYDTPLYGPDALAAERERLAQIVRDFPAWLGPQAKRELLAAMGFEA